MKNPYLQLALDFISTHDLNELPTGRHDIDGDNVFVNIADSPLRTLDEAKYEVHNKYIDIQIPLSGPETYAVKSRNQCKSPVGVFDDEKDYLLFNDKVCNTTQPENGVVKTLNPGEKIIFYPQDAHAPLIGHGMIHKAIFKVLVASQE